MYIHHRSSNSPLSLNYLIRIYVILLSQIYIITSKKKKKLHVIQYSNGTFSIHQSVGNKQFLEIKIIFSNNTYVRYEHMKMYNVQNHGIARLFLLCLSSAISETKIKKNIIILKYIDKRI